MSNDPTKLEDSVKVEVIKAKTDEPVKGVPKEGEATPVVIKLRHKIMGWFLLMAMLGGIGYSGYRVVVHDSSPMIQGEGQHQDETGLAESIATTVYKTAKPSKPKFGGVAYLDIIRAPKVDDLLGMVVSSLAPKLSLPEPTHFGPYPNTVATVGKTALRDCMGGTGTPTCTAASAFKFHGLGTSSTAPAAGDTGCTTELTTQYNPDNTRATGSQTNNGSNVYRTVGTNTVDAGVTVAELCIMSAASGGTLLGHVLTGSVALSSGDSLQSTYDFTLN